MKLFRFQVIDATYYGGPVGFVVLAQTMDAAEKIVGKLLNCRRPDFGEWHVPANWAREEVPMNKATAVFQSLMLEEGYESWL